MTVPVVQNEFKIHGDSEASVRERQLTQAHARWSSAMLLGVAMSLPAAEGACLAGLRQFAESVERWIEPDRDDRLPFWYDEGNEPELVVLADTLYLGCPLSDRLGVQSFVTPGRDSLCIVADTVRLDGPIGFDARRMREISILAKRLEIGRNGVILIRGFSGDLSLPYKVLFGFDQVEFMDDMPAAADKLVFRRGQGGDCHIDRRDFITKYIVGAGQWPIVHESYRGPIRQFITNVCDEQDHLRGRLSKQEFALEGFKWHLESAYRGALFVSGRRKLEAGPGAPERARQHALVVQMETFEGALGRLASNASAEWLKWKLESVLTKAETGLSLQRWQIALDELAQLSRLFHSNLARHFEGTDWFREAAARYADLQGRIPGVLVVDDAQNGIKVALVRDAVNQGQFNWYIVPNQLTLQEHQLGCEDPCLLTAWVPDQQFVRYGMSAVPTVELRERQRADIEDKFPGIKDLPAHLLGPLVPRGDGIEVFAQDNGWWIERRFQLNRDDNILTLWKWLTLGRIRFGVGHDGAEDRPEIKLAINCGLERMDEVRGKTCAMANGEIVQNVEVSIRVPEDVRQLGSLQGVELTVTFNAGGVGLTQTQRLRQKQTLNVRLPVRDVSLRFVSGGGDWSVQAEGLLRYRHGTQTVKVERQENSVIWITEDAVDPKDRIAP